MTKQTLLTFISNHRLKRRNPLNLKILNVICILICWAILLFAFYSISFVYSLNLLLKLLTNSFLFLTFFTHFLSILADPGFIDPSSCPFDFSDRHVVEIDSEDQTDEGVSSTSATSASLSTLSISVNSNDLDENTKIFINNSNGSSCSTNTFESGNHSGNNLNLKPTKTKSNSS